MYRNYRRKIDNKYTVENLRSAIGDVKVKKLSQEKASILFNVL